MSIVDIFFLAIALAMDCFAISVVSGVIVKKRRWPVILQMSILFGLFQAFMPFLGWLGTSCFSGYIEPVDHWIAFILLVFVGGRMVKESFEPEEEIHFCPDRLRTQLLLSVATSIDALAVGISFACIGYAHVSQLIVPLVIIGFVSFLSGVIGNLMGIRFGRVIARKFCPEAVGGVILILIGIKILLSHLCVI